MSAPRIPEVGTLKAPVPLAWDTGSRPAPGPRREAYDALADLFLGDAEGTKGGAPLQASRPAPSLRLVKEERPREAGPPRVEALIIGHLPILASAWVLQYARTVADQIGATVAVLRLRPGSAMLELAGKGSPELVDPSSRFPSLREAVNTLRGPGGVRAWLIRVDQVAESSLAAAKYVDTLTILAGVDEAATVAAYTSIKQAKGSEHTPVRLALMGGTPEKAQASSSKVARTAEEFLGRKVEVAACVQRIAGGRTELAWSGGTGESIETALAWLCPLLKSTDPAPKARVSPPPATPTTPKVKQPEPQPKPAVQVPAPLPAKPEIVPAPAAVPAQIPLQQPSVVAPGIVVTAPPSQATRQGRLSRHLPGLSTLAFTCPYAPSVELATGADGVLHLLALDGAGPDPAALGGLTTAAAWVKCHQPLLRHAVAAEARNLAEVEPVLHLLTTSAPSVRRLGDSGIRLHVLVSTRAGSDLVWGCADLN